MKICNHENKQKKDLGVYFIGDQELLKKKKRREYFKRNICIKVKEKP
jgi:hypothetical protein